jgi:hypothetical protein
MRQTCTNCNEHLHSEFFGKDSRKKSGLNSQCNTCRNVLKKKKVKCPNCSKTVSRAFLYRHKKSSSCTTIVQPWSKFKASGTRDVICPCKHKQCRKRVKESVAYRHVKYGINYRSPKEVAARKARNDPARIEIFEL